MSFERNGRDRILGLHAAAKRLQMPERTLRYQAGRGRIQGAFKEGKLWKFPVSALESQIARSRNLRPEGSVVTIRPG